MNEKDKRYAPNVLPGNKYAKNENQRTYTEVMVAKFLGWTKPSKSGKATEPNAMCRQAFEVLEAVRAECTAANERGQKRKASMLYTTIAGRAA